MPEILVPKFNKLYRCRYGFNGAEQVCLLVGYTVDGYTVRKWLTNSRRWTNAVSIRATDLLGRATQHDCRRNSVDASALRKV